MSSNQKENTRDAQELRTRPHRAGTDEERVEKTWARPIGKYAMVGMEQLLHLRPQVRSARTPLTEKHTERQTERTERHTERVIQKDTQTVSQRDIQTDRQTDR